MRVMDIVEGTSVDGPGLRTSIYFAGCGHACPGCHNPSTWDFAAGNEMTADEILERIDCNGFNVTFSGGDPMYSAEKIIPLAREIRAKGYSLWCYTGFQWEELLASGSDAQRELLSLVDVLVDGPFVASLRDTSLLFRGSSNQRLINVAASLDASVPVLWEPPVFE